MYYNHNETFHILVLDKITKFRNVNFSKVQN